MKKILSVVLILFAIIMFGCGEKNSIPQPAPVESKTEQSTVDKIEAVLLADSFWVLDSENMPYLADALSRQDAEYLDQLMLEGKVFHVDKDTKVTRFGVAADKDNVLIIFNEGRYTNKTGCTFARYVINKENFHSYLENQKKKKFTLIQEGLNKTEKYADVIATGNLQEIIRMGKICLDCTNATKKLRQEKDKELIEAAEMAIDILVARDCALSSYKSFIEYSEKAEQESLISKKRRVYDGMRETFKNNINKYSQEAEKKRQEFRDKYGF